MADIRRVQEGIKTVESEIKEIQAQITHIRAKRVTLGRVCRRPRFPGISDEQVAVLETLTYDISVKRRKKAELNSQTAELRSVVSEQVAEIAATERQIAELPDQIDHVTESRLASQSNHDAASRDLADKRLQVRAVQRLHKDAFTTLSAVSLRKDVPMLDRPDLKPLREQIGRYEDAIRRTQSRCGRLGELIRLEERELAAPPKRTQEELELISALDDPEADSLEFDVLRMTQELKAKRRELRDLQVAHVRAPAVRERFSFSRGLSDEQKKTHSVGASKKGPPRTFSTLKGRREAPRTRTRTPSKLHPTPASSTPDVQESVG